MMVTKRVRSEVERDVSTAKLAGMFDLTDGPQTSEFSACLPDTDDWQIGAIVGPSGSGKTTIAREAYGASLKGSCRWSRTKSLISQMPSSVKDAAAMLTQVGLGTAPAWLRPFHTLSGGEQFRATLARRLLEDDDLLAFDEYTSVVDRTVAQFASAALSKVLRRKQSAKRFVAVSCHYDFLSWLAPDWVVDMGAGGHLARDCLRRPDIHIGLRSASQREWALFARHHYLRTDLPRAAQCFIGEWESRPIAFVAAASMAGKKGRVRISRIVTLPDYQGMGIGAKLTEQVADLLYQSGRRVNITTSHPSVVRWMHKSDRWDLIRIWTQRLTHRKVASFEWTGHETASANL